MDLSSALEKTVNFLMKYPVSDIRIYIHSPSEDTLNNYITVANLTFNGNRISASGSARSRLSSNIKAIAEIGEIIICKTRGYSTRAGIAGGFIKNEAINRAKSELLEHDAFLYHYRNKVPFTLKRKIKNHLTEILIYQLLTKSSKHTTILATDPKSISDKSSCIMFSTATHENEDFAIEKAISQYCQIYLNHSKWPTQCQDMSTGKTKPRNITDIHHISSRDHRNKEIFKVLCPLDGSTNYSPYIKDKLNWIASKEESPMLFFKYYKLMESNLIPMNHGTPEKEYDNLKPLYHPFW